MIRFEKFVKIENDVFHKKKNDLFGIILPK
jgi:hypothetical protein